MRQRDLGALLGHSQAKVSNVERGERRLDVIELRDWLDALDERFADFISKLDEELVQLGGPQLHATHQPRRSADQLLDGMLRGVSAK